MRIVEEADRFAPRDGERTAGRGEEWKRTGSGKCPSLGSLCRIICFVLCGIPCVIARSVEGGIAAPRLGHVWMLNLLVYSCELGNRIVGPEKFLRLDFRRLWNKCNPIPTNRSPLHGRYGMPRRRCIALVSARWRGQHATTRKQRTGPCARDATEAKEVRAV
eukprot:COSAG03_NODE_839_length_5667_cov_7.035022_3_plen_162_part_00